MNLQTGPRTKTLLGVQQLTEIRVNPTDSNPGAGKSFPVALPKPLTSSTPYCLDTIACSKTIYLLETPRPGNILFIATSEAKQSRYYGDI